MPNETDQIARIAEYVGLINHNTAEHTELLTYVIEETVDRVLVYLNADVLEERLERIVARIVSGIFNQTTATVDNTDADLAVKSISDNGQSITYSDTVKNYLATSEDGELFGGFAKLLAPYRRINVVS